MIQRKQTLFLFVLVFCGIALLSVPGNTVTTNTGSVDVNLVPLKNAELTSSTGHLAAVALNFLGLILTSVTIFLYNKRTLQLKLCYGLMFLWLILTLMMAFCPFVVKTETVLAITDTHYDTFIGVVGMLAAYMAARFIKKDIELLKSADRIR
jgi:hypothetical protein